MFEEKIEERIKKFDVLYVNDEGAHFKPHPLPLTSPITKQRFIDFLHLQAKKFYVVILVKAHHLKHDILTVNRIVKSGNYLQTKEIK